MLTKGAIGNLVNRYRAVLTKCNLINTFGSLAVAAALVLGGAGVASASVFQGNVPDSFKKGSVTLGEDSYPVVDGVHTLNGNIGWSGHASSSVNQDYLETNLNGYKLVIKNTEGVHGAIYAGGTYNYTGGDFTISGHLPGVDIKSEAGRELGSLEIESKYNCFTGYGTIDVDSLKMTSSTNNTMISGVPSHDKTTTTDIYANTISIEANELNAIQVYNQLTIGKKDKEVQKFDIEGDYDSAIVVAPNSSATIYANELNISGASEAIKAYYGGTLSITAKKGNINSDFEAGTEGEETKGMVDMTLGSGVTWTGRAITDTGSSSESNITLNGATWKITGASNISTLTSDGGILDTTSAAPTAAAYAMRSAPAPLLTISDKVEGELTVVMDAEGDATIEAGDADSSKAKVTVVTEGDADSVSQETAKDMLTRVNIDNTTVSIEGGVAKDGYTVTTDENGNAVVSGGGASDVTKAALQQASVTTIALDKILTNDVRKRLGDIRSDKNTTGVWMRWDGGKMKGDSGLANNFNTIQIGGDTKAAKNCRIGFAGSFTHGDMDFNRGGGELEGFSFALYGTWMGDNGMFADVVARLGKFSTEMNVEGNKGDMDNRVASLSAEYGWRFDLAQQFFIEPQVELAYTYVSSDDLQLGDVQYQFDSVDSLTGRAGLVAGWNLPDERGNVYARASVVQQFMGDAKITGYTNADPVVHETDGEDTWLEYGIGANVKLTDSTYVWADVERTEGAKIEEEWRGTVGVRYSF